MLQGTNSWSGSYSVNRASTLALWAGVFWIWRQPRPLHGDPGCFQFQHHLSFLEHPAEQSALQIAAGGVVDLNGGSQAVGSLSDVSGSGGTLTNSGVYPATLTVGNDGTSTTFSGPIRTAPARSG